MMRREAVLLGVDFDGTLAPLVDHPDLAVPDPRGLDALRVLANRPGVLVAVVSGRALADLALRLGELPGAILVGEHGNDIGEEVDAPAVLDDARAHLGRLQEQFPGATVETKRSSVTFHTRGLEPGEARTAEEAIRDWAARHGGITLLEGKNVFELTVATRTKGDAISDLGVDSDGIVYVGDDLTDETVFDRLGERDIGVKVGPGETSARYRVDDVTDVVSLLEMMSTAPG